MQVSRAIALSGVVDLVSRLGIGWLSDRPSCVGWRGLLLAVTWIVEGLNALIFAELDRYVTRVDGQVSVICLAAFIHTHKHKSPRLPLPYFKIQFIGLVPSHGLVGKAFSNFLPFCYMKTVCVVDRWLFINEELGVCLARQALRITQSSTDNLVRSYFEIIDQYFVRVVLYHFASVVFLTVAIVSALLTVVAVHADGTICDCN